MNPTVPFFAKLKKLAVNLESETVQLQHDFAHRNNDDDDDDSETTARAMRTYHQMNCEVGNLKGQIQGQIAQLKARENDVDSFIKASRVMQQKMTKDIQAFKGHWEKYGYQAPRDTQRASKANGQQSEAAGEESEANEAGGEEEEEEEEEESQEEAGGSPSSSPQTAKPPDFTDVMRTPQLSDFGLSEMQLKKMFAGCSEVPPMPEMSLPHPSLYEPAPPMPFTPKCALRMDDEDLQTPQLSDFGITEHTMCLINDFTMDLFKKSVEKPQRPSQDLPEPPVNALTESLNTQAHNLESPEPPVFCTPGLKILKKTNVHCSSNDPPESPRRLGNLPTTPEIPAFLTPYMNCLVSSKKSAQQPGNSEEDSHFESSRNGAIGSKCPWEYNVPEISSMGAEEMEMPEMPNLESILGNSLQKRSEKMLMKTFNIKKENKEPTVNSLDLDGPTQNFSFGTPRIRMDYEEPITPEMPDLSSETQDICKLVSQAQLKNPTIAVEHPNIRGKNDKNRLPAVSESEFQSLPKYLRQMTLHNLNQVVEHINTFTAESEGEHTEFQMEELLRICRVGTKTPIFILCLTELKRLKHIGGSRNTSVYKLWTQN